MFQQALHEIHDLVPSPLRLWPMAGFGLSDNELGLHQALYAGAMLHESSEEICFWIGLGGFDLSSETADYRG